MVLHGNTSLHPAATASLILLIADGARPDTLAAAIARGELPELARLQASGSSHTLTSVFPSVTGPAYTPFLLGCHPGTVGLPGIRWFDRARTARTWLGQSRSYVGLEMRAINQDLDPTRRTLFEQIPQNLASLSMIERGLAGSHRVARGARFILRSALTHFRGNVPGWLDIDRDISEQFIRRVHREHPRFAMAAFTGIDKTSHAAGHNAPIVLEAMRIVDHAVGAIRQNAERAGTWDSTHIWVVSDHGHSPVAQHDDLADVLQRARYRVRAHPKILTRNADVAVMVSGNAMAHIYVELTVSNRSFWPTLHARWNPLLELIAQRPSVDLVILPTSPTSCDIQSVTRGRAALEWDDDTNSAPQYRYRCIFGDPLGLGDSLQVSAEEAYHATRDSDYPDALVQIARLVSCNRSGDIIVSAKRHWDFRGHYEPIEHVSAHGALHREHMLVPLLTNHPVSGTPKRTVDIGASAAHLLGVSASKMEGESFI